MIRTYPTQHVYRIVSSRRATSRQQQFRDLLVKFSLLPSMLLPFALVLVALAGAHPQALAQSEASENGAKTALAEGEITFADRVREIIDGAIAERKMPGCVLAVGNSQGDLFVQSYGHKRLEPTTEPMAIDTVFDMASITKPVATATAIMKLIEEGRLRRNDTVASFFPSFASNEKKKITVEDLLLHTSGLIPDNALADYQNGVEKSWERICDLPLTAPIGTAFKYSDVNFIVLGKIVEKLSGQDLNSFSRKNIFPTSGPFSIGSSTDIFKQENPDFCSCGILFQLILAF
jgi:CubicO group peptidase (beta-lactamase class C family)